MVGKKIRGFSSEKKAYSTNFQTKGQRDPNPLTVTRIGNQRVYDLEFWIDPISEEEVGFLGCRGILKVIHRAGSFLEMAEKLDPKETVSFDELLTSNIYTQEALINLLEQKGIITKRELLKEIKRLRDKQKFGKA
jgi:hypothetical protein